VEDITRDTPGDKWRLPARSVGQAAVQLFDKVFDGDTPPQLTASLVLMLIDPQARAESVEHLDDLGRSLLGQQIDLQIEMIPTIGDHPHAVLLQGERIEWSERRECRRIHSHPGSEG
jgi:hypothetical protein